MTVDDFNILLDQMKSWVSVLEHPDCVAIVNTIMMYPDDDAPRHIWIDWLEEHAPSLESIEGIRCSFSGDGIRIPNSFPIFGDSMLFSKGLFRMSPWRGGTLADRFLRAAPFDWLDYEDSTVAGISSDLWDDYKVLNLLISVDNLYFDEIFERKAPKTLRRLVLSGGQFSSYNNVSRLVGFCRRSENLEAVTFHDCVFYSGMVELIREKFRGTGIRPSFTYPVAAGGVV